MRRRKYLVSNFVRHDGGFILGVLGRARFTMSATLNRRTNAAACGPVETAKRAASRVAAEAAGLRYGYEGGPNPWKSDWQHATPNPRLHRSAPSLPPSVQPKNASAMVYPWKRPEYKAPPNRSAATHARAAPQLPRSASLAAGSMAPMTTSMRRVVDETEEILRCHGDRGA